MEYNFREIEKKWQKQWKDSNAYKVENDFSKPKYYVLDMFPYPSGAGLHVGHPLGYIASDIYSRYKRLKGFNVLHPMGFDSFGLPAEQYALDTGQHPAETTKKNIETFKKQLDNIGFCYDWSREVQTSDPNYYKWTQWIFLQLFNSYFCNTEKKALPISLLIKKYETKGAMPKTGEPIPGKHFTAEQWNAFSEKEQADTLMKRRLAFCGYGEVNWCEALGTVLANDEVVNGVSERGGHPVVKKTLRQWYLRITEYADRLLEGLNTVNFSDAMKEMQSNWIGKSSGAEIDFAIKGHTQNLKVYTTRPDTIFGVDFMVIAPELDLVNEIKSAEQTAAVDEYLAYVKSRSERERMAEKKISGVFTGAYAVNPFSGREIPIWISEYVLAGYGTGAIMAVPCGDERDLKFAKHFNIPVTNIIGAHFNGEEANPTKDAILENSGFLDGLVMREAMEVAIKALEDNGIGTRKVNYKIRDAAFSRQRYWGEPFPITWKDGIAKEWTGVLPLVLPNVEKYSPGPDGQGPLANIPEWVAQELETNTMPGYAGSSWYFLRYMDNNNDKEFCSRAASDYWNQVDLYIGGTEHAVGHLLYSRMWTKVLYDLNLIGFDEPYKRLVNQGMIQGSSRFVYRVNSIGVENLVFRILNNEFSDYNFLREHSQKIDFVSHKKKIAIEVKSRLDISGNELKKYWSKETEEYHFSILSNVEILSRYNNGDLVQFLTRLLRDNISYLSENKGRVDFFASQGKLELFGDSGVDKIHVDVNIVDGFELDIEAFKKSRPEYVNAEFVLEDGKYICGSEVEKMSKSKFNTVNPDDLVAKYGADTFRMYEMFLGPVEMSKPWDTKGIEGVHRFLKKFWRLFADEIKGLVVTDEEPTATELKVLHQTIKKIESDTERFSFNTGVSGFMIATNELTDLKCHKRKILEPLLILLVPYAPHITEELWSLLGNSGSILNADYPTFEAKYVVESSKEYPVSINGKLRTTMNISLDAAQPEVEKMVLENDIVQKWLEGKAPKKIIFVKGKMVNVVV
jgi:leucyl-tRNA synthetase